jgi:hypothetical protein
MVGSLWGGRGDLGRDPALAAGLISHMEPIAPLCGTPLADHRASYLARATASSISLLPMTAH